jgi:DNA-binding PadR family transcriptional regulator
MMTTLSPDSVLLGLLEAQSCHGYQLLEHFRAADRLGRIWNLSTSQLYAILKRLEREELIDGREEDSVDAPMRTVYWLTDTGRYALHRWLTQSAPSASTRHIRTEFLSRLYIARLLGEPLAPIITAQREACIAHLDSLIEARAQCAPGASYLSLELRIRELDVIIDWLALCEPSFNANAEDDNVRTNP